MRSFFKLSILTAVLLLMAGTLLGQGTTGNLAGIVTQDGNALPGVTVTATSPNLQGERTTVTNESGGYNIGNLPPGPYTVRFELSGLQSVTRTQNVGVAQNATVNADLRVSAVTEAITVTAAAPAVAETKEVQSNFSNELIEELPVARTVVAITNLSPGVVQGVNGPSISGGFSFDNLYTVNGAVIQENLRGQPHNLFIEDAIQETTVQVAGISAEFGNFTGGVVNAITKSGGNEFSGSLRDSLLNPSWTSASPTIYSPTVFRAGETPVAERPLGDRYFAVSQPKNKGSLNQTYEATLGGRIIRDRLWFFAAGREAKVDAERVFGGGNTARYDLLQDERRLEGKLTASITSRHSFVVSMLDAPVTFQNECQTVIGCFDATGVIGSSGRESGFQTASYNGVITNNFLVEGRYSAKEFTFVDVGGVDHDRISGTPLRLGQAGGRATNESYFCGDCTPEERDNSAYAAKLTYYLGTSNMGTHNLTGGYDHWHEKRLSNNFQSPTDFVFWAGNFAPTIVNGQTLVSIKGGTANTDYMINYPILESSKGSDLNTDSLWFNDRWDISNRWSANLGVRYDKNDSADSQGRTVADDSNISPRVGVAFDTFGNGRLRFNASYGVYTGRLAETIAGLGSAAGTPAIYAAYYGGPDIINATPEAALTQIWSWYDGQGGFNKVPFFSVSVPGAQRQIPESLVSPNVEEMALGVATQLGAAFLRADYVQRDWRDFYASERNMGIGRVTLPNGPADLEFVRNSDDLTREYQGLTLQGAYRLLNRINLGGNYTWSELTGNATLESVGSVVVTEAAGNYYPEYYNFAQNNPSGFLPGDSTHKIRAWAAVDFPTVAGNFNVSVLQAFDSGNPYSLVGSIDMRSNANYYGTGKAGGITNPGYVTPPSALNYYFSERGEFRFDDVTATSLALNYDTNPSWLRGVSLFVQAEILNVFNADSGTHNTTILTHRDAGQGLSRFNPFAGDVPIECPQAAKATECAAMGAHFKKDPRFGLPTGETIPLIGIEGLAFGGSFQAPRTYRGSVGFRF